MSTSESNSAPDSASVEEATNGDESTSTDGAQAANEVRAEAQGPTPSGTADESGGSADERSDFLKAVVAPISDEAPAGDSIRYDEDFRSLKTQIDAIGSASGEADYDQIVELARGLLTEKSKELQTAGYLVLGEARLNGASGVAEAARALWMLIDTYWEDLYPKKSRMRGRGNALQFVADRLPEWLESASFEAGDRAFLEDALDALNSVQEFSLQEMGEHAPAMSGLINDLEGEINDLPAPEPDPEPEPEDEPKYESDSSDGESDERPETASSESTDSRDLSSAEISSETEAAQAIRTAARYHREDDLTKPLSYRLLRTIRWDFLQAKPPNEGGTTRFEPPRAQRRDYLEGLLEEEKYETLVREGESSFQSGTFHVWFDLQRLIASALGALGAPYEAARTAVIIEVGLLMQRVPGVLSLTFSDETPFATALTVDWIETQVEPLFGTGEEPERRVAPKGGELEPVEEQYEEARKELTGGRLEEALATMKNGATGDASKKQEFHRRLYVANLCVKGGEPHVARPLLDELDKSIEQHTLDAWDPSLALEVWTMRCQCYDMLAHDAPGDESEALLAEAEATFEKICRTDPAKAVSVDLRSAA